MEEVKVTVNYRGKITEFSCTGAVVVAPNRKLEAWSCDGVDLLKIAAMLDISFNEVLKVLNDKYELSYTEIYGHMERIKESIAEE